MGNLSTFVPEDRDFLVGVFYKVGVWISHIDDDGEDNADSEEEKVLMRVFDRLSKKYKTTPLISQLTAEAGRQTSNHARWMGDSEEAVAHAVKGAEMIKAQMGIEDLKAYRMALQETGRSVATAFREGEDESAQTFSSKIKNVLLKIRNKGMHDAQNISPTEDTALIELFDALRVVSKK